MYMIDILNIFQIYWYICFDGDLYGIESYFYGKLELFINNISIKILNITLDSPDFLLLIVIQFIQTNLTYD